MRIVVIGKDGQVARALRERAGMFGATVANVGRPELDLSESFDALSILAPLKPDVIVNAAAYTAVDRAESEEKLATRINGKAPGLLAAGARDLDVPFIHLSTDYVFDGSAQSPYSEDATVCPTSAYGRSKLEGEREVARSGGDTVILRLAWVYSRGGQNFVRTMLRLAETRDEVSVVADQVGSPTNAADAAEGIIRVARDLVSDRSDRRLRGIFHMAGAGYASWADFAEEIFRVSATVRGPHARVKRITTAEYPTPARRPANSRLDCSRLAAAHGVALPDWRPSVGECVRLLAGARETAAQ